MTDTVIFVANGFTRDNVRLQPWRYVYELAKYKSKEDKVIVITEGSSDISKKDWEEGFSVIETRLLSVKKQSELGCYLKSLEPIEVWWSTTPRSIAFYPTLSRLNCHKIAFITCPLYKWVELIRASLYGVPYEQTKALWKQRLIPRILFKWFLNGKTFNHVVVQSKNNQTILKGNGIKQDKISLLPVGIDEDDVQPVDKVIYSQVVDSLNKKSNEVIFLYFGAIRPIRGFDALIKALPYVSKRNPNVRLVVLARGAPEKQCNNLLRDLDTKGLDDSVSIVGGWLSREQVWAYIELADIVVLPFLLVPSDIPIAVLESLARGKPVVVSPVDGLPELAYERGVIVDPLNTQKFSEELYRLSIDSNRIEQYTQAAINFTSSYPRWSDVGSLMQDISNRIQSKL